ncbi:branched-chain amino acid transport system ATP-binding protein [Arboricoccus pini]|uniref:Branched-chain amino acid transport system ATP-binding protein n=1 Tax=Arboricoccus pini TaxID=1963835 RepID=A0A212RJL7_9PROT|nr:ABC transporter ATP-binding protein [Arboricoccus pini]SNB72575.1 branched-chain amino acid transport system ATP-binding protein [Arboricoccus pini]
MNGKPVLRVDRLVAGYEPGLPIVNGASLTLRAGEIVAILGPNGAGKSTLIKAIAGLVATPSGQIWLNGTDLRPLPAHKRTALGLGFVPQTENVFTRLSILDNLKLAAGILPAAGRAAAIDDVLSLFPDLAARPALLAGRLSGGQRQMLAVARALVVKPRILMLDEPSAGLSPRLVLEVFAQLGRIRAQGITILLVEQNVKAALALADRGIVLVGGRERHEGRSADLLGDPGLGALFLGGDAVRETGS